MTHDISHCTGEGCQIKEGCVRCLAHQELDGTEDNPFSNIDPAVYRVGRRCYYKKE
ncbi:MAG: hypothetical protein IAA73_07550 [Bacteroidetes bacterium]|uniref:Uncharacterized protein n=1 Tax=Candidatus Gallipaludibacter merdavium TaxID=2840839 RepID=A0A9D9HUK3_9BACT|nr:hypothetical protein [Candidatus Gallipaludibacter merdavium]